MATTKKEIEAVNYKTHQEAVEHIDWVLLLKQKRALEKLLLRMPVCDMVSDTSAESIRDLWGLVELIENLEDMHENEMNSYRD